MKIKIKINLLQFVNTIALAVQYTAVLDKIYEVESKTMMLEAPDFIKRAGATSKSILLPKVTVDGMKNYSRATGYLIGDNTLAYETHTYSIDRGIEFTIDRADDMETINSAFGFLSSEFMRTQMVPEVDAYRFATLAGRAGNSATIESTLSATNTLQLWDDAMEYFGNTKVPKSRLVAFVTPTFKKFVKQSNLIERQFMTSMGNMMMNRDVEMLDGIMLMEVPQDRFFTQITLQTGNNAGFVKTATTGRDLNFLICDMMSGLADKKIDKMKIFDPETNQTSDGWKFQYRIYHDIFTPDNKVPGIYVNHKPT